MRFPPTLWLLLLAIALVAGWLTLESTPLNSTSIGNEGNGASPELAPPGMQGRLKSEDTNQIGQDAESRQFDTQDNSTHRLRTIRIEGTVLNSAGIPVQQATIRASGGGGGTRHSVSCRTEPSGHFECTLRLPQRLTDVVVVAEVINTRETAVTYPSRHRIAPDDIEPHLHVTLVTRLGAQVIGSVPGAKAEGDGRAMRVLVSELPTGADEQYHGWNEAGFAVYDRIITPETSGAFSLVVRPGEFQVRTMTEDGQLGPVESSIAKAGQVIDIGQLLAPGPSTQFSITIVDSLGTPIPRAWIQLSDRSIRFATGEEEGEFPHLVADHNGTVRVRIPSRDLPMQAVGGSSDHSIQAIELTEAEPNVQLVLGPRRRLTLRLTGDGASSLCAQGTRIPKISLRFGSKAGREAWRTPLPLAERLAGVAHETGFGISDPRRCTAWAHRPPPGNYDLTLYIGPTAIGHRSLKVSDALADTDPIEIPVGEGRLLRARLDLPPGINRVVARSMLQVQLLPGPLSLPAGSFLDSEGDLALWVPPNVDTLAVTSRNTCLLPLNDASVSLRSERKAVLAPKLMRDSASLTVRVVALERQSVASAWSLHLANFAQENCGPGIIGLMSDDGGKLSLVLRTGEYEVRSDRSFIKPYARQRVVVRAGQMNEVVLPIVD